MGQTPFPDAIELARCPTPMHPLDRLSQRVGRQILCKRDDLTGSTLTGNKVRKLEFLLAEAIERDCDGLITCGGAQSNHARATAIAAAQLGLRTHLLLRTEDPHHPPEASGNILMDRLVGARIEWISRQAYEERDTLMYRTAARLKATQAAEYYVVPEGGSNALGAWGYVRCAKELLHQIGRIPATIVLAVGSGGTAAGLIAGCRLFSLPYRIVGICVAPDGPTFQRRIATILSDMSAQFGIDVTTDPDDIEIWPDYVGRGYALSRDEELKCLVDVARTEGLLLDPVYTGKAMYGLLNEIATGRDVGDPIVFLHTGGIYGLMSSNSTSALNEQIPPT